MGFFSSIGNALGKISNVPILGPAINAASGGLVGLGADYLGDKFIGQPQASRAFAQDQSASATQYKRNVDMYKHRYQWTMADMAKAGLNPILAASSGGFNVSGGPTISKASGFQAHAPYGAGSASAKGFAQTGESKAKTKQAVQNVEESKAKTKRAFAQCRQILSQTKVLNAQEENLRKEWFNIEQKFNQLTQQIGESQAREALLRRQGDQTQAQIQRLKVEKTKLIAETKRIRILADQAKNVLSKLQTISDVYKTPYFGQALTGIAETSKAIPIINWFIKE